jgi:Protein of unknown function (DUF3306)
MAEEARGFLGRWARRKTDALQGKPLEDPNEPKVSKAPVSPVKTRALPGASTGLAPPGLAEGAPMLTPSSANAGANSSGAPELPTKPVLSLEDVKLLTKDSDFKPFMSSDVGPEVRNAAMKKLFADPHFNVMDGLDIYIDDYSLSDPIPESMLRQMASAKFLKLFDDDEDEEAKDIEKDVKVSASQDAAPQESAKIRDAQITTQPVDQPDLCGQTPISSAHCSHDAPLPDAVASPPDHANSHLRLQPDHAAPGPDPGRGT